MNNENTQLKVKFPVHLYRELQEESKNAGVTMASLVKLAVALRYSRENHPVPYGITKEGDVRNGN